MVHLRQTIDLLSTYRGHGKRRQIVTLYLAHEALIKLLSYKSIDLSTMSCQLVVILVQRDKQHCWDKLLLHNYVFIHEVSKSVQQKQPTNNPDLHKYKYIRFFV